MKDKNQQSLPELTYKMKPAVNKVLINVVPPESRDKRLFETENRRDMLNSDLTSHEVSVNKTLNQTISAHSKSTKFTKQQIRTLSPENVTSKFER